MTTDKRMRTDRIKMTTNDCCACRRRGDVEKENWQNYSGDVEKKIVKIVFLNLSPWQRRRCT